MKFRHAMAYVVAPGLSPEKNIRQFYPSVILDGFETKHVTG